ncbi:unnamed protein product [Closterium sp. Naga37s-1]|nr:unnamed protein product [Closterium sp. Naga37s-1]
MAFDYGVAIGLEARGVWREWLGEADHALLAPWLRDPGTWAEFAAGAGADVSPAMLRVQLRARSLLLGRAVGEACGKAQGEAWGETAEGGLARMDDDVYASVDDDVYPCLDDDVDEWHAMLSAAQPSAHCMAVLRAIRHQEGPLSAAIIRRVGLGAPHTASQDADPPPPSSPAFPSLGGEGEA